MFLNRLRERGRDLRDLGSVRLGAIGSATAARLGDFQLRPDIVPAEEMNAAGLLAALTPHVTGKRLLLAAADRAREMLREELARFANVEYVVVYAQAEALAPTSEAFDLLRRGEVDFVTLTSSNIAKAFLSACDPTIVERLRRNEVRIVTSNLSRTTATVAEPRPAGCR